MTRTIKDLADEVRPNIREVDPATARELLQQGALLLDVRDREEHAQGAIEGAVNISRGTLEMRIGEVAPDPDQPIVCHCAGGHRGALAADALQRLGYRNVVNIAGGLRAYREHEPAD
ncbi:rhodanese-like domain-containing protein [Spiribacter halobius]|uniref:Sulfurtransferase n=1 Tax=Sediminicurvatus halobius TaxID=2182432 RepID=A0A2U2N5F1_9GAMM|nr:rhodanese-like domain-containing protein [Spiribacter halobius]PWG64360.1 sulfurtransferase [Spiribacter halobius]UEX79292.1 rhodanese-like domain-containing protein [Spiribacter halobius]